MRRVRVISGIPLVGYRWWTWGRWPGGVKCGPVTFQASAGVDVSLFNRWRVIVW